MQRTIVFNEAGMPEWAKIALTITVSVTLSALTGWVAGAAGAAISNFIVSSMLFASFTSTVSIFSATVGGLFAGALVGGACGFVAGSIEVAMMGGLYRQPVDKIFLDYAIDGAVCGAISGAIIGGITGGVIAKKFSELWMQHFLVPHEMMEQNTMLNELVEIIDTPPQFDPMIDPYRILIERGFIISFFIFFKI